MNEAKTSIFISYSHLDRAICDTLATAIESAGDYSVWYDKDLTPGEEYRRKIADVIGNSDFFIVLLSQRSVCSQWVLDEVDYAKKLHKKILPIWIEDATLSEDLDMILQRYHSLFWHLRASDSQFMDTLCASLSQNDEAIHDATAYGEDFVAAYEDFKQNRLDSAFLAFSQLAGKNHAKAQYMVARMYEQGLGTEPSAERADFWYRSAAQLGDPEAQYVYGTMLVGKSDSTNKKEDSHQAKGMALIKTAADHGHQAAMEKYVEECCKDLNGLVNLRCSLTYCDQLIQQSNDPYEKEKYARSKRSLILQQLKITAKQAETIIVTVAYVLGVLVGLLGILYLLTSLSPDLYTENALLQKIPAVTEESLIPVKALWDWILTYTNIIGAYGLQLVVFGQVIRAAVSNRSTRKFLERISGFSYIAYAGIALWFYNACPNITDIFHTGNMEQLAFLFAAFLISLIIGYIIGAAISSLLSIIFPTKNS